MAIFEQERFRFPGPSSPTGLRAEAEAYVASLGLARGTPGWGDAIRRYFLDSRNQGISGFSSAMPPGIMMPTGAVAGSGPAEQAGTSRLVPVAGRQSESPGMAGDSPVSGSWSQRPVPARDVGPGPGELADPTVPGRGADAAPTLPGGNPASREIQLAQIPPEMKRGRWRTPELMGRPHFPRRLTALSERYELPREGGGAATISLGRSDPGGQSYGRQQLALKMGSVREFLESEHADRWRDEFNGLKAGSRQFNAKWREIAAREPDAVDEATFRFVEQRHYRTAVATAKRVARLDLDSMSDPVRAVVWSTIVQHGGWNDILVPAIRDADRHAGGWGRGSPQYDMALITSIYERRMANEMRKFLAPGATSAEKARARKMVEGRYLPELQDALALWRADQQN